MQRLQPLQPEIKKIQARYKDDRQRMNQEVMAFYQREKVNPLGLLPPAGAADPVLHLALLSAALATSSRRTSPATRASCSSTTSPRRSPDSRSLLGILIVLYVGTQLAASAVTAFSADPTQRRIMFALPFVFVDLHHQLPGGPDRLLDHDQRLDDRPAAARQEALPEARAASTRSDDGEERPSRRAGSRPRRGGRGDGDAGEPTAPSEGRSGTGRGNGGPVEGAAALAAQEEEALAAGRR